MKRTHTLLTTLLLTPFLKAGENTIGATVVNLRGRPAGLSRACVFRRILGGDRSKLVAGRQECAAG